MPGTDTITEPRSPSYTTPGTHPIVIRKPMIGADASGHPSSCADRRRDGRRPQSLRLDQDGLGDRVGDAEKPTAPPGVVGGLAVGQMCPGATTRTMPAPPAVDPPDFTAVDKL